jgi:TetR/AcrR family transcriptional regulator, transcriptional repressor for nem operon
MASLPVLSDGIALTHFIVAEDVEHAGWGTAEIQILGRMANSAKTAPDKRQRLIESAKTLFHERGVHPATLADIAARADVPLGNIYYYFKTKDELIGAVIESRTAEAEQLIDLLEQQRTPQIRLKALAQQWVDRGDVVSRYGCPIGSLCSEIDKDQERAAGASAGPFATIIEWIEQQFRQLGRRDARDLALSMLARIEGASLLAHAFRDPQILIRETRQIDRWIDGLQP